MVAAIFYVLYCGVTGTLNILLAVSIGLVGLEGAVFLGNGRKCPLTNLAKRYGDPKGYIGDIFLPEWLARRTDATLCIDSIPLRPVANLTRVCPGDRHIPAQSDKITQLLQPPRNQQ